MPAKGRGKLQTGKAVPRKIVTAYPLETVADKVDEVVEDLKEAGGDFSKGEVAGLAVELGLSAAVKKLRKQIELKRKVQARMETPS
jgi:hypothetical protein